MNKLLIAATGVSVAFSPLASAPALAEPDHHKWEKKQRKQYRKAQKRAQRQALRDWRHARNYDWNRYEPGYNAYYADRYYRSGNYYGERRLGRYDRIYRGRDGRYYCRRSDGTTGLIVGAAIGGLLGNQLRIGGSATLSTLIGGAAGAVLGREIARGQLRCN